MARMLLGLCVEGRKRLVFSICIEVDLGFVFGSEVNEQGHAPAATITGHATRTRSSLVLKANRELPRACPARLILLQGRLENICQCDASSLLYLPGVVYYNR